MELVANCFNKIRLRKIKKDYIFLENKEIECAEERHYFGKILFNYPDHSTIREYLYTQYIKDLFEGFKFVIVCMKMILKNGKK